MISSPLVAPRLVGRDDECEGGIVWALSAALHGSRCTDRLCTRFRSCELMSRKDSAQSSDPVRRIVTPHPADDQIDAALDGHICRCGSTSNSSRRPNGIAPGLVSSALSRLAQAERRRVDRFVR